MAVDWSHVRTRVCERCGAADEQTFSDASYNPEERPDNEDGGWSWVATATIGSTTRESKLCCESCVRAFEEFWACAPKKKPR